MADVIEVKLREDRGKRHAKRLRKAGGVPGVLYGHGQETISLSLPAEALESAIQHGRRVVSLTGGVTEQAFIRECQWDTWGIHVIHVDLTRVSEHEKVQVRVQVEVRGEAPGIRQGGVVKHVVHEVLVTCEVTAIPEKVFANVNQLELGAAITVADLATPEGLVVDLPPETVIVQCVEVVDEDEEDAGGAAEVEPEVIGRKKEDGEE
jgi:large subunit ribosomal protein L25